MKYVIIIPDGCADEGQAELGGQTPLQAARTPTLDQLAQQGIVGRANHTPIQFEAGSAVANLSLLGYSPFEHYTGRAPLEAAAQGIELGPDDWCIRCNLVTIENQVENQVGTQQMRSFTAGHISSAEARQLLQTAQSEVAKTFPQLEFIPGVSYRNLLMCRSQTGQQAPFSMDTRTTPPHDLTDQSIAHDFPRGPGSDVLCQIMQASSQWFEGHPVNQARLAAGKLPATNVWLWGLGQRPQLESFEQRFGLRGAMITAVYLLRGIAALIGWDRIEVPGATGYTDTDYAAKGRHAIAALQEYDLVAVHIEAPDESSHEGDLQKKNASLEEIDQKIVAPIYQYLESSGQPYRILVSPDHPTFLRTKTHTHGDVPFLVCGTGIQADSFEHYHEVNAAASELAFPRGWEMIESLFAGSPVEAE